MSTITRLHDDEISQSSDEKMDTGSESLHMHTPSSLSDEDPEPNHLDPVLRLQNPQVLRLSIPGNDNMEILNDTSLINSINNIKISMDNSKLIEDRPTHLSLSPKFSSTLISTTSHPLMGLGSPDENYPDLIPKRKDDDKDLSLSSIDDEKPETNGLYSPERNTSKNNLYFDSFNTAESHILQLNDTTPPDVARGIEKRNQRSLVRVEVENKGDSGVNRLEVLRVTGQSTPKRDEEISEVEDMHSGVSEWCESPAHVRGRPNFDLPIELKTTIKAPNDLESPDVVSSSQEDRSAYQALLDPYTGSVALRPTPASHPAQRRRIQLEDRSAYQALLDPYTGSVALRPTPASHPAQRRRILLPPEDDQCSLDSGSVHSLESEEEPPEPEPEPGYRTPTEQDHSKLSTNTISSCSASEPIPEYSAAEELRDERSWLSVPRPGGPVTCDMKVIEPYKRVVSHGGYDEAGCALVVFSACHLPDVSRPDYHYVMDNLFLYVIWTLERLVPDNYVLVYLYGSAGPRRLPTIHWLREYYKLVDRRLRKSLKHLYLVHPTYGLRIFVAFTKAFVSSKFFRKLSYVRNLSELMSLVPVEPNAIPEIVKQYDAGKR